MWEIYYTHVHDSHMVVICRNWGFFCFDHIDHIAAFKALYYPDSVTSRVHMHSVDVLDIHTSTKCTRVLPLIKVQQYGALNTVMWSKYTVEWSKHSGIINDFCARLSHYNNVQTISDDWNSRVVQCIVIMQFSIKYYSLAHNQYKNQIALYQNISHKNVTGIISWYMLDKSCL